MGVDHRSVPCHLPPDYVPRSDMKYGFQLVEIGSRLPGCVRAQWCVSAGRMGRRRRVRPLSVGRRPLLA